MNPKQFLSHVFINMVRLSGLVEMYQPTYNPHGFKLIGSNPPKRDCEDRLQEIVRAIDISRITSYLDVGSQLGFYVFRLADQNGRMIAQGVEKNRVACAYANALTRLNGVRNVSFTRAEMTGGFARSIPNYDLISFMSVFHHVVHFDGFEAADAIMRELYRKCGRFFVFETGQFDEKGYYWSEDLSFMGDDPTRWIEQYLLHIGYDDVKLLALCGTHLSDRKRGLFLAMKARGID